MEKKKPQKKKPNKWIIHVKEYQKAHPNKPYGECMAEARKTYQK